MDRLIQWLSAMRFKANLIIIGSGEQRENLSSIIQHERLEKQVHLINFQDNPIPYMVAANAVLLGSRWEGLPNVGLEALALGKVVIATGECGGLISMKLHHPIDNLIIAKSSVQFIAEMEQIAKNYAASKASLAHNLKTAKSSLPVEFNKESIIKKYKTAIFGN